MAIMLFITHDLGVVRQCRRPGLRDEGRRDRGAGQDRALFAEPQHPYTQMLLAAEPKGAEPPRPGPTPRRSCRPTI
jgi:microcin C transport system ATP-binding protein